MSFKRFVIVILVLGGFLLPATGAIFVIHVGHVHEQHVSCDEPLEEHHDTHHQPIEGHDSKSCTICHHVFVKKLSAVVLPAAVLNIIDSVDYSVFIPDSIQLPTVEFQMPHLRGPPDLV